MSKPLRARIESAVTAFCGECCFASGAGAILCVEKACRLWRFRCGSVGHAYHGQRIRTALARHPEVEAKVKGDALAFFEAGPKRRKT